jgi:hypothetical protein
MLNLTVLFRSSLSDHQPTVCAEIAVNVVFAGRLLESPDLGRGQTFGEICKVFQDRAGGGLQIEQ